MINWPLERTDAGLLQGSVIAPAIDQGPSDAAELA